MTKKEKAEYDAAIRRAELWGAFCRTKKVHPDVMPPPGGSSERVVAFTVNSYGKNVKRVWCTPYSHGPVYEDGLHGNGRQGAAGPMYSSERLAWEALRNLLEQQSAADLLAVDRELARLDAQPSEEAPKPNEE